VPRPAAAPPRAPAAEPDIVPREVLVEVRAGADLDRLARRLRLAPLASHRIEILGTSVHRLAIRDGRSVEAVLRALRAEPGVAAAQPNAVFRLAGGMTGAQYALAKLRLPQAHDLATGEAVTVAVIDSGVDEAHPELAGAVAERIDTVGGAARPHAHGTGIAGIIAARGELRGVAPASRVLAIRAFSGEAAKPGAEGTTVHVLRALDAAAARGARVVNMSFAGRQDDLLSRALAAGRARGMIFVAAAGNAGPGAKPLFPAADPSTIAVSAVDAQDRVYASANRGAHIAVAAPGVDVLVAAPAGAYQTTSGTSMAAAHVSGVVALLLQRRPDLTPDAVRSLLTAAARDLGPAGPDAEFGAGLADALKSLEASAPETKPTSQGPAAVGAL
jgi:subtilisin family serine protease